MACHEKNPAFCLRAGRREIGWFFEVTSYVIANERRDDCNSPRKPGLRKAVIALSYRREDTEAVAGRLYDRLQSTFGRHNVFMDFDSIPAGVDFREHITRALGQSHVVIALIGPNWLGERLGLRRIDDANDFVRFEIKYALECGIPIIPVLVNEAAMPGPDKLPPDINNLAFRNALPLDSGLDFHSHADRLVAALRALPASARPGERQWLRPTWLIAGILAVVIAISVLSWIAAAWFRSHSKKTARVEAAEIKPTSTAAAVRSPPSSSPPIRLENIPVLTPPTPDPSAPSIPIREFRGRWSSVNSSPFGGNGSLTVSDELVVEDKEIQETVTTEWVSGGTSIFRMSLRIRFGELWALKNQLNARCLATEVVEVYDPKEFGKFSNLSEQTANAAKAGINLVYTWTLNGTELRRGGTMWTREK